MSIIDWSVLLTSLVLIIIYGIWKSRGNKDIDGYLLGNKTLPWYAVCLSVMATQASAITFLSAPGQAYTDGMRFVQYYFGLPIAMVILCVTAIPLFHKLKVYTAYEYLETRFDLKTRALAALLFLIQRGLAAGLTIYAPAIILSVLLGWDIYITNIFIGGMVILYTVTGGSRAVSYTQLLQMTIILSGMFAAALFMLHLLPEGVSFTDALHLAGKTGRLNVIDTSFDLDNKYNIWSGLIGGLFLALAYFGTDQSQVSRYLAGRSTDESRLGLLMNGIVKIPMQFGILLIGALLFTFYHFEQPPVFFNSVETQKIRSSPHRKDYMDLEKEYIVIHDEKETEARKLIRAVRTENNTAIEESRTRIRQLDQDGKSIRERAKELMKENDSAANTNDVNYIFLAFILDYFPQGMIGLIIAVMFAASMSSTSSELNALASATVVDIYKRMIRKEGSAGHYLNVSRWTTVAWGAYAILIACFATRMGSLIEAVNVLGSLFYGTILGIFLVAFYLKRISGSSAFYAALAAEAIVLMFHFFGWVTFLWYNVIGCIAVIILAWVFDRMKKSN